MVKTLEFDSRELPYTARGLRRLYGSMAFQMGQVWNNEQKISKYAKVLRRDGGGTSKRQA